jgi:CheY-like chemotaxis protein
MACKKILVVEDNDDNREIFVHRLRRLGPYEILEASNGKEALETAAQSRPDLIFMDLRMPIMDGCEATRALRKTDWGRNLPVVAVTAYMEEERENALRAGCTDFITKPITDYSVVRRSLQKYLERKGAC